MLTGMDVGKCVYIGQCIPQIYRNDIDYGHCSDVRIVNKEIKG